MALPPLSQPWTNVNDFDSSVNDKDWSLPLYRALLQGKWKDVKPIFQERPETITARLTVFAETPLLVAVKGGQGMRFIAKLVNLMPAEALALTDYFGNTALHAVAVLGNIQLAKLFVEKNSDLPNIWNNDGYLPIHVAARRGQREMTMYLFSVTEEDEESRPFEDAAGVTLMGFAISAGIYDLALHLLKHNPKLSWQDFSPLEVLAQEPSAFPSGMQFNILQSLIYSCVPLKFPELAENLVRGIMVRSATLSRVRLWRFCPFHLSKGLVLGLFAGYQKLHKALWKVLEMLVPPIKHARHTKLMHNQALQIVQRTCVEIKNLDYARASAALRLPFLLAAQNGIHEIVREILYSFPHAITFVDEENHTALHLAVMYRHEKIFKIIHKESGPYKLFLSQLLDDKGNNMMHLSASRLNNINLYLTLEQCYRCSVSCSGIRRIALLSSDCKLLHLQEVEKFMLPQERKAKNSDGKTPLVIFNEEHRDLVAQEGQWMIGMATSCTVAASLIATVVFAAAITVPGGNGSNGLPILSNEKAFIVFALSDALALLCSITTVLAYLSIFTSRYAVNDFLYALPNRLIIGLISLFLSVTSMMIAFSVTVYLVFARENPWMIIPIATLACIPVALFAYLQLPPLLNMIKSTYGPSILDYDGT